MPNSPAAYSSNKIYKFEISIEGADNGTVVFESNHTGNLVNYSRSSTNQVLNESTLFMFNLTDQAVTRFTFRWCINNTYLDTTVENHTIWYWYQIILTPTSIKFYINGSTITTSDCVMNEAINATAVLNITDQICLSVNRTGWLTKCGTSSVANTSIANWAFAVYNFTANFTGTTNKSSSVSTIFVSVRNYSLTCAKAYPDYIIMPSNATEYNVTPYGQSSSVPFFNCTNRGNQTIKINVSMNATPATCVIPWAANSSGIYNRYNTTAIEIIPSLSQNQYKGIWLRENLNDCNATAIGAYEVFEIYTRGWF
jgi:hypothetical protein